MNPIIARSTIVHTPFVVDLQRRFSNQVGFLPAPAIEDYALRGRILIATENGCPAGYLLGRPALRWQPHLRPITQAAVCMDAQRRHIGLALVEQLAADALAANQLAVQACCREEIDANEFWKAAGFDLICKLQPENARRKLVNVWRRQLTLIKPAWYDRPPALAGWRCTTPTLATREDQ